MSPVGDGSIEKAPSPPATDDGFQGQLAGQSGIILAAYSAPTAPPSTSFNESQKKSAADFVAAVPKDTGGIEVAKKDGRGRAKATSAEAAKGGGQMSITAPRRARGNRNATTAQYVFMLRNKRILTCMFGRGLCKNNFLKSHKGATVDEWQAYWKALNESERKVCLPFQLFHIF